ncbi:hypothetical protein U1Q18_052730 [Sarracenia purpurea var. burkii]
MSLGLKRPSIEVLENPRRKKKTRTGGTGSSPNIPIDLSSDFKEAPSSTPPLSVLSPSIPSSSKPPSVEPTVDLSKLLAAASFLQAGFENMGDLVAKVDRLEEIIKFALQEIQELKKKEEEDLAQTMRNIVV